jgi:hypothetical protein
MKKEERIKVEITRTANWYKKGEIHEVFNYLTFTFARKRPMFEKDNGLYGIDIAHCKVITPEPEIPEYTLDELSKMVGHKFKLKVKV